MNQSAIDRLRDAALEALDGAQYLADRRADADVNVPAEELLALVDSVGRVTGLHWEVEHDAPFCDECGTPWPCATIRALQARA